MQNIYEILKGVGITVPEDKKEEFDKLLLDNYKTIKEYNGIKTKLENAETERDDFKSKYDTDIKQRDADIETLQTKLKDAGTDSDKLATLQNDLKTLQTTYDTAKSEYEKKLSRQAYEFAVKEKVSELKFSSNSAKKAFIADALKEEMKIKDGELQGFDSFLESYKKSDADAFLKEDNTQPDKTDNTDNGGKPFFSAKSSGTELQQGAEGEKPSITFF